MKYLIAVILIISLFSCGQHESVSDTQLSKEKLCVLETSLGTMVFRFFEEDSPETCKNIQDLVQAGYYNGKDFYRVVKGHVIQAGGGGKTVPPEFNDNPHLVGTVGLGRTEDINSGSSEFYICLAPRPHLDGKYTVFGQLIEGLDVLEKIGNVEVDEKWAGPDKKIAVHKPKIPVIIKKAFLKIPD